MLSLSHFDPQNIRKNVIIKHYCITPQMQMPRLYHDMLTLAKIQIDLTCP